MGIGEGMTTHYVTTLGVAKCTELKAGDLIVSDFYKNDPDLRGVCTVKKVTGDYLTIVSQEGNQYRVIRRNWFLMDDRTDSCTDIRNHLSPNTKVVG